MPLGPMTAAELLAALHRVDFDSTGIALKRRGSHIAMSVVRES